MTRSILLYGDVNTAYRDGSRIWLESTIDVLARTESQVTLLLKAFPPEGEEPFGAGLGCTVLPPSADHRSRGAGMRVGEARDRIVEIDAEHRFDIILTRGYEIAKELSTVTSLEGRLWPYITDGPGFDPFHAHGADEALARIARSSRRVLVQTEDARSVWEACVPSATGKTLLLPPMVPDRFFSDMTEQTEWTVRGDEQNPLKLVYSGKFARAWKSLEIPHLPDRLSEQGIHSTLTMIGDKIHHSPDDRPFPSEMRQVMSAHLPDVEWCGGLARDPSMNFVAQADVGIGWRAAELDTSLEISTKLLEYAAIGSAPVVNRTGAHERLLGPDYPLFIDDDDVVAVLDLACDPEIRRTAAKQANAAVQRHRVSRSAERLNRYFHALEQDLASSPSLVPPREDGPLRVLFSSHDFKFSGELIDALSQRSDIELRLDIWQRLAMHDPDESSALGDWADVILCEWAGHNAVFHSRRKRSDQRMIVRFHGFEIRGNWLRDIMVDKVDAFVFVSDFYRREILEKTGWPEFRTTVIPNVVDVIDLEREKLPGAQFHLGLAGYVPILKRPDRALDLLEHLVAEDDRFILHFRGRAPWTYPWEWAKPIQRSAYEELFKRIRSSSALRDNVQFENFSPDMGSWFRGIGWVLSPSVKETFHLAPVEGMASGTVPLVWNRPGASEIFGEALFDDVDTVAKTILRTIRDPGAFGALSTAARSLAQSFDMSRHRTSWISLLDEARSTPLPLRGRPVVEAVPASGPESPAHVAEIAERALSEGDSAKALDVMTHPAATSSENSYVGRRLAALRERALLLDGLRSGLWVPPAGLGPVYLAEGDHLHAPEPDVDQSSGTMLDAVDVIEPLELGATPILAAADALVTRARRERPSRLVAPADAGGAIATAVAARRLGIELDESPVTAEVLAAADREIPGIHQAFLEAMDRAKAPVELADLTIGLIADTFTARAVSHTLQTISIPRHGWKPALEEAPVDLILVESAWSAPGEEWFHGIAYHGDEEAQDLRAILTHARERGIPTLFWNREDPVHLKSFSTTAADFDTVLTSDANCIPAYLSTLPTRTSVAASLPFFADPTQMHPVPSRPAEASDVLTAYAGTYYGKRYPQRTQELRTMLTVAAEHGVAIYDRQATIERSRYKLPNDLQQYSRGGVPADQMPEVYRRHPVHLNVNSVTDSPTMFSRRVVEIASSGSLVLSGKGDGVRSVLGPTFPVLEDEEAWRSALIALHSDSTTWRSAAWAQLRTVRRSYTSTRSLTLALRIAGLPVIAPREPQYALLVPASLGRVAATILGQSVLPEAVALAAEHPDRAPLERAGIRVVELAEAAADLGRLVDRDGWVGVLAAGTTRTHYEDLLYAVPTGDWQRIASRPGPVSTDEEHSLLSAAPIESGPLPGALYSREVVSTAEDIAAAPDDRTIVWISDAGGVAQPSEGD